MPGRGVVPQVPSRRRGGTSACAGHTDKHAPRALLQAPTLSDGTGHAAYWWDQNSTTVHVKMVGGGGNLEIRTVSTWVGGVRQCAALQVATRGHARDSLLRLSLASPGPPSFWIKRMQCPSVHPCPASQQALPSHSFSVLTAP